MKNVITISANTILTLALITAAGCGADFIGTDDLSTSDIMGDVMGADVQENDAAYDATQADAGDRDMVVNLDAVNDSAIDATDDVALGDITEETSIEDTAEDAGLDVTEEDTTGYPVFQEERQGWAWNMSPLDVDPTQVTFQYLESPAGKLTGAYADVWNCLREPGGATGQIPWNGQYYDINLCHYRQTVVPGEDGSYLHVEVPQSPRDGNDSFAEGHMYYSINKIHDYFFDSFGHTANDRSLFALVNIGFQIEYSSAWMPLDNAAFLPDATHGFMGFNMHEGEMLAFGQGSRLDFSSDAGVIFHEYTHFTVTGDRLSLNTGDRYGFNADPIAINEGFADYFPSTIFDNAVLGEYALGEHARDLSEDRRCPDDYIGESHNDGRIWSSSLWDIREAVGATIADELAYRTLIGTDMTTTFVQAAAILMEECEEVAPEHLDTVRTIFEKHNIIECPRVFQYNDDFSGHAYQLPGRLDSYAYEFQTSVVSIFQYQITVPEGMNGFIVYYRAEDAYGYDDDAEVRLMVKRGDEPISWRYSDRPVADADKSFSHERLNSSDVAFTVAGDCVTPGVYTIQLVNKSAYTITSRLNNVAFFDDLEDVTWGGCDFPDDPVVEQASDIIEPDVSDDTIEPDVDDDAIEPDADNAA